ncbi:MAG: SpoIIE family protein phosphatase [Firmicutes bacterium]|nr:SpoIIE family protein phosphatase [Bacillota bacterium]
MVVFLWSFAVFLASVFAGLIAGVTLTPKLKGGKLTLWWLLVAVVGLGAAYFSYSLNLYNDLVGILGLTVILCAAIIYAYEGTVAEKLFVGLMSALIANVATFMFCGTTDTFVGARLGFFDSGTPYNIPNILLFIGIKIVVYAVIFALYMKFLRNRVREVLVMAGDGIKTYLIVPAVSVVGFYVINLITNSTGIVPTNTWFLPLYLTICVIFVVEYVQIFNSVRLSAEKMQSEKEKERIGAELNVATQIQADMLPRIFPAFPERNEFDLFASMAPAKEVGGDFYDFFLVDDDHIALVMADVSGKGVPAALFMVIAKTLIKNRALLGESPATVLKNVNEQLCEGNEAELFVTVWLAVIEISTGKGMAANAGHEHPVLRRAGGRYELVTYRHSPAVATMEGIRFREHPFELHPGDSLFVYTDGVPEATNSKDELFGNDRMLEALNSEPDAVPEQLLKNVRSGIDTFVGDAPQFDDITMLGFTYMGPADDGTKELTIEARPENIEAVTAFIDEQLDTTNCSMKAKMQIEVAVEELFVNIAHYAYSPEVGNATIGVKVQDDGNYVTISFKDSGTPYDPLAKPDPDTTLSVEDRPIGGLGIYMVKKSMDDIKYEFKDGQNILTIKKNLE